MADRSGWSRISVGRFCYGDTGFLVGAKAAQMALPSAIEAAPFASIFRFVVFGDGFSNYVDVHCVGVALRLLSGRLTVIASPGEWVGTGS